MTSLHHSFQPYYITDREEEIETHIKCDCCFDCGKHWDFETVKGHDTDNVYLPHISAYLANFKGPLLNENYDKLEQKINDQLKQI